MSDTPKSEELGEAVKVDDVDNLCSQGIHRPRFGSEACSRCGKVVLDRGRTKQTTKVDSGGKV